MAITQIITAIPKAGKRGIDTRDAFVTKQEAFQDALTDTFVTEINAFRTQANTLETNVNNKEASAIQSATTATTKANEASTSATTAATKANEASASASTATTKATEASNSASSALSSKNSASASATTATTKASEASSSASSALSSMNTATTKASEASASANTASTKATEASNSATTASTKASEASSSASSALASKNAAKTSETNSKASEVLADKWANENKDVVVQSGKYSAKHYALKAEEYMNASDALKKQNNLSDLPNKATARFNLGLENINNTSDDNKPISIATQTALNSKTNKSEIAYNVNTSSFIQNTLASGAIIERGSNSNGEYIKFADGTMICHINKTFTNTSSSAQFSSHVYNIGIFTFPSTFAASPSCSVNGARLDGTGYFWAGNISSSTSTSQGRVYGVSAWTNVDIKCEILVIGKWK